MQVPEGWKIEKLGYYIDQSIAGEWGTEAKGDCNDIPVLRATNFSKNGVIDYSKLAIRNISKKKRVQKSLKVGDIVIEKSGGSSDQPVGRVIYFDNDKPFLYSNFTQKLSPANCCNNKYLFYKLYHEYYRGTVLKFQQQTTGIINFQLPEYLLYKTIFPPLPEQEKIAEILSTCDDCIESTDKQIAKLKDLKKAMMQELLTKGIDHKEFKESSLGKIPKSWAAVKLEDISERATGHTPDKKVKEYWNGGVKWVSLSDSKFLDRPFIFKTSKEISQRGIENSSARLLPKGTVILLRDAGVGKSSILGDEMAVSQHFVAWKCGYLINNIFLYYLLQFRKQEFEAIAVGSTIVTIGMDFFKKFTITLPPLEEQKKIADILSSIDDNIESKERKLSRLKDQKKALMNDLLTGKVRVKEQNGYF